MISSDAILTNLFLESTHLVEKVVRERDQKQGQGWKKIEGLIQGTKS